MVRVCMCVSMCGVCLVGNERQQCTVAGAGAWCRWKRGFYGLVECIVRLWWKCIV